MKQVFFSLIIFLLVLLLLEGAARLVESQFMPPASLETKHSGWQTEFFGSLFDWHEPDPDLLWRFKADLKNPLINTNSQHTIGPEITERKPAGVYRILILGDSSPVGLGLKSRRQTFAAILKYFFDRRADQEKKVEVINGAVSGYSSEQVLRFLEIKGWDYDPDLIITYCGNNDASISGVYTDRELLASQKFKALRAFLSHTALYRVARSIIGSAMKYERHSSGDLQVRVLPEEYGENLEEIKRQCEQNKCPLIILKPPVPHLWPAGLQFKPFLHVSGGDGEVILPAKMAAVLGRNLAYCLDEDRFRQLYGQSDIFTREVYGAAYRDTLEPPRAIEYYSMRIDSGDSSPINYNNLGVNYWRSGQYHQADKSFQLALGSLQRLYNQHDTLVFKAARSSILYNTGVNLLELERIPENGWYDTSGPAYAFLDSALQNDFFSLRIKRAYGTRIDRLKPDNMLIIIDLPSLFYEDGGERLFIDHCHPTAEGHFLIARAVFDSILARRW